MAAKSPEQVLPVLPPEVLSMVVRSFRWNEDVANIHDTWTKLRSVCHLFKVIVDKDFLSSTVFQHAHRKFSLWLRIPFLSNHVLH